MTRSVRLLSFLTAMMFSLSAFAAAVIDTLRGDVRAGPSAAAASAARKDQRILQGTTVVTGPNSMVTLRFDDGQTIILNQNSEFRLAEYSFTRADPARDKFVLDLLKGALRSVTGVLTPRNRQAYALRVPQATIGVRGTDFMVALVNPAYLSVLSGAISATNAAGAAAFAAGSTATIASSTVLAASIAASALPASVAASFSQLGSIAVSVGAGAAGTGAGGAGGAGAGAAGASGAAVGGVTLGTAAAIGAAVAAVAAVTSADQEAATTGTTGTTAP